MNDLQKLKRYAQEQAQVGINFLSTGSAHDIEEYRFMAGQIRAYDNMIREIEDAIANAGLDDEDDDNHPGYKEVD